MNEGTGRSARGDKNPMDHLFETHRYIEVAEVVSVDDPYHMGRIKVRIKGPASTGGDDGTLDTDLPWCFPLLPKTFSSTPKPREAVFVMFFSRYREFADRLYIGPIISQPDKLNNDPYYNTALRGFTFASVQPDTTVDSIPELDGVFPDVNDVSIQGRYNTEITQKHNQVVIRAGKFEINPLSKPYGFVFNSKTQSYIQMKNDAIIKPKTENSEAKLGTVTNVVANKINLLTHEDGNPRFNLLDQKDLISDETLTLILKDAHQLPYGDILLEYLILLKNAILYHVHNGSGNPATDLTTSGNQQTIAELKAKANDLEKRMLSKNVRIN